MTTPKKKNCKQNRKYSRFEYKCSIETEDTNTG